MKVCVVSRVDLKEPIENAQSLGWMLLENGHEVVYEDSVASELGYEGVSLSSPDFSADLIVVLGGDGSVLRAVRMLSRQVPVVGVNQGRVGFLTDLEREHACGVLSTLELPLAVEPRMRLSIEQDGKLLGSALNEAVVVTSRPAKMLQFATFVDGNKIGEFRADGLILGTPTGSTAYAMSAGGPIVDPLIEAFVLVPLAPYMLSSRPYLISSQSEITVQLVSSKPAQLVLDGQMQFDLGEEATLVVRKSLEPALFLNVGRSFFGKVEQKLRLL
ncbi:NAD kinase [Methanocorpusculaceae archaeon Sp1]|uniref:NAD kinase n=1 Tax=Methanorbis furvi TaxID=3028299 RepID=A0AAE4ME21_9EURY|nr:NAD kinase [Methanocorpusculaceae archaeon Sp1]MDV0442350.1 NAD kinase [Methanocorpusculaceae archaeon Ag1]